MKFGAVPDPEKVDFTLPSDHTDNINVFGGEDILTEVYVGCAKWNRSDLRKFYPRGTKDELTYYATQFNAIELNATHYNYSANQMNIWGKKVPDDFRFFPKIPNSISHYKRLNNVEEAVKDFTHALASFEEKSEMVFLQMHDDFRPNHMDRLAQFAKIWPTGMPLGIELRNTEWFNDQSVSNELYNLFEQNGITNIITDTAGRRDLLHMRLTTPIAFIRYVGANHASDRTRLDEWLDRLALWKDQGLEKLYFFIHQNLEKESPHLSKYFIDSLNNRFNWKLRGPTNVDPPQLF